MALLLAERPLNLRHAPTNSCSRGLLRSCNRTSNIQIRSRHTARFRVLAHNNHGRHGPSAKSSSNGADAGRPESATGSLPSRDAIPDELSGSAENRQGAAALASHSLDATGSPDSGSQGHSQESGHESGISNPLHRILLWIYRHTGVIRPGRHLAGFCRPDFPVPGWQLHRHCLKSRYCPHNRHRLLERPDPPSRPDQSVHELATTADASRSRQWHACMQAFCNVPIAALQCT